MTTANSIEVSDDEVGAAPVAQPKPEAKAPEPKAEAKSEPRDEDGAEFVEIEDAKLKARFNRLYRHTKEANEKASRAERQVNLLAEQNKKLQQALETMYVGMKDEKTHAELKQLKQSAKEALATGDTEAFINVNERLLEIKQETKAPPVAAPQAQGPAISDTEMKVLKNWQDQVGDDDEPVRPWAKPDHPEFATTQDMIRRVAGSADMADASIREILGEVDRRMAKMMEPDDEDDAPRNPVRRAFSAPRSSRPPAQERTSLTAQERAVAEMMFMGGRGAMAKSAKDAHALYLKQKQALTRAVSVED
jgi:hypothetical protein